MSLTKDSSRFEPGGIPESRSATVTCSKSGTAVLGRLRRNRRGAMAAEFAIVSPVLIGLMFGTIEYGLLLFSYSSMQSAARDVTRQVAVNTLPSGSAVSAIRSRLPTWMASAATITLAQSAAGNPAANVYTVTVSVPASAATPISFYTRSGSWNLQTQLQMKQELPYIAIE